MFELRYILPSNCSVTAANLNCFSLFLLMMMWKLTQKWHFTFLTFTAVLFESIIFTLLAGNCK